MNGSVQGKVVYRLHTGSKDRGNQITVAIGITTVFCMTFGISIFDIGGYRIPLPYPDTFHNIAIQVILAMKKNLLPKTLTLYNLLQKELFLRRSL